MCRNTGSVPLWFLGILTSDFFSSPWSVKPFPLMFPQLQLTNTELQLTVSRRWCNPPFFFSPPPPCAVPWPPTHLPAPTPTRPREWTWPTALPTCGSKPRSTAWTRCPRSTEKRGGRRGGRGHPLPLYPAGRHCLWDEHHPTYVGSPRLLFVLELPWVYFTWMLDWMDGSPNSVKRHPDRML